jgi:hypothetical protein
LKDSGSVLTVDAARGIPLTQLRVEEDTISSIFVNSASRAFEIIVPSWKDAKPCRRRYS